MSIAGARVTEDRGLLLRMKEGSSEAFDALYEKYWEVVYAAAYRRLNDPGYAKDITQDIFLRLWTRRDEIEIDNLQAYLLTAVRNNVFKWMEREQKYTPIPDLLSEVEVSAQGADANVLQKEFLHAYEALLGSLTPSQQTIFTMRFHQDLSTDEISRQLNISRKTVQNQLGRSIIQLRESLTMILLLSLLFLF
ncbi:RNA polymerase sigma factor [Arcticibacter sp. MXS-1]|uniref:RNA polymerase sigma factor n=1 Tax=Arcticibacter sp. MXS-1 TaxID=3341726 RepID=UPI0035A8A6AE